MKTTRDIFAIAFITLAQAVHPHASAQESSTQTSTQSSTAISPLAPEAVPPVGTFYLFDDYLKSGNHMSPPYPMNPYFFDTNVAVYGLGNSVYMVDNTTNFSDDSQLMDALNALEESQTDLASSLSVNGMEMNADTPSEESPAAPDYVDNTNLWIEVATNALATPGQFGVVLHNTVQDEPYDVLATTNLLTPLAQWPVVQTVLGTAGDSTSTQILTDNEPNLFVIARYAGSSTADLIPNWWEVANFGTNSVDPYGDPDGDGWSNLEEYQNGSDPTVFTSPKPVSGVQAVPVISGGVTNVTLTWPSPSLSVSGFSIIRTVGTNVTTVTVGGNVTTWTDYNAPIGATYQVTANYSGGSSAPSSSSDPFYNPSLAIDPEIVRGPAPSDTNLTSLQLVLGGTVPTNVVAIRVYRTIFPLWYSYDYGPTYWNDYDWEFVWYQGSHGWSMNPDWPGEIDDGSFEAPMTDFTNGVYRIKKADAPEWCAYYFRTQPIDSKGIGGAINDRVYVRNVPFIDGSLILKDNLSFVMRIAGYGGDYDLAKWNLGAGSDYAVASAFPERMATVGEGMITEMTPFADNWLLRNWAYDTNFAEYPDSRHYKYFVLDKFGGQSGANVISTDMTKHALAGFNYVTSADSSLLLSQLETNLLTYVGMYQPVALYYYPFPLGLPLYFGTDNRTHMATGKTNYFGLPYERVRIVPGQVNPPSILSDISPGGSFADPDAGNFTEYFQKVSQPVLRTVDYYFVKASDPTNLSATAVDVMPGDGDYFSATNSTPLVITAVGKSESVFGWAKQQILNGDSTKFGYLGQYFDKAYKTYTIGNATSTETGILSEYGEFFATEPGRFILKTKPDAGQTNIQGECTVYAISLNVDANHDGTMDLTYSGLDTTSATTPMQFWVNNDHDFSYGDADPGQDLEVLSQEPISSLSDCANSGIDSIRDLEDFARLWVCGMPALTTNAGYQVKLSLENISGGSPVINLFSSVEGNGGIGYLTNLYMAGAQIAGAGSLIGNGPGRKIATISSTQSFTFPSDFFTNNRNKYFLFEGAGIGAGQLKLTVSQGPNVLAQTSAWLDLRQVKDLFDHAHIVNPLPSPPNANLTDQSSFVVDSTTPVNSADGKNLIVFVHGWRCPPSVVENFAETMFKRLYWQGYQGRFAAPYWPTLSRETDGPIGQYLTFNRDEYDAFKCAKGMADYFVDLQNRFPGYAINVGAHSHGNIVMMEVLKRHLANGQSPIHNYALLQAAVAAECLDTNAPIYSKFATNRAWMPDSFYGYAGAVQDALSGNMVNFYNTNDFGVVTCWEPDQMLLKPDYLRYSYDYMAGTPIQGVNPSRVISDPHEIMAFACRPTTQAAGAVPDLGGPFKTSQQVDLTALVGFGDQWDQHSGEFNWNIQRLGLFYRTLLTDLQQ